MEEDNSQSTENTEIIYSNTDRTDLTDFYIPLSFFCPAESWIFNGPAERAEMAEIFILTQRRRGRRVLFEHGLNGFLYPAEIFNYLSHRNGGKGGNFILTQRRRGRRVL